MQFILAPDRIFRTLVSVQAAITKDHYLAYKYKNLFLRVPEAKVQDQGARWGGVGGPLV